MAETGAAAHWRQNKVTGEYEPPDLVEEFIEWMFTSPQVPSTQREWAAQHGVHPDTVKRWKRDPKFREAVERKAQEVNLSPDRIQKVLDALYFAAVNHGDVAAMKEYLRYVERFLPPKVVADEPPSVQGMSDAELEAEVRRLLADQASVEGG